MAVTRIDFDRPDLGRAATFLYLSVRFKGPPIDYRPKYQTGPHLRIYEEK